jgi:hypothetical protein
MQMPRLEAASAKISQMVSLALFITSLIFPIISDTMASSLPEFFNPVSAFVL